jgi:hypothetical protein
MCAFYHEADSNARLDTKDIVLRAGKFWIGANRGTIKKCVNEEGGVAFRLEA